ncbi:MAG: hypothetical protein HY648_03165 [Acidobacteria bacterium]|nr:hypothetical protein [Acidobacteriota bacterium]
MNPTILGAILGVLLAWALVALAIRHWGPGFWSRTLLCPEKKAPARVTFERREGSFGSLKGVEVQKCSLFPDGLVACEKRCLG